jgi:D-alanyl-D-alanine dipeptidase/carboxypeptidase
MSHTGNLILVNQQNPYRGILPDKMLAPVGAGTDRVYVRREVAAVYEELAYNIGSGERIIPVSGWRTQQEQEQIYHTSLAENGTDFTRKYVALPGHSEHQTGLAIDLAIARSNIDFLRPHFPRTGIGGDFRKKAGLYGFIERYPKGKERITGIAYEPWHFRYVGAPHATIMNHMGITLEEYHVYLKEFPACDMPLRYDLGGLEAEISYLVADEEVVSLETEANTMCEISGNNVDGFVMIVWRGKGCRAPASMAV